MFPDTVDIYLTPTKDIKILDFNVFGKPTNPLLFDWDEDFIDTLVMVHSGNKLYSSRIIEHQSQVLPSEAGVSRGPIDVSLAPDFYQFMNICRLQNQQEPSDL